MDVVEGTAVELLNKFCFLVDVLSVGGDTDAAVEARVHKGWNKFRQLLLLLTIKDVSLLMRRKSYRSCVRSCMYVTWQRNVASEESEQVDTSAGLDEND